MKPRVSSLNPYAASYVPLSKRETSNNVTAKTEMETINKAVWTESSAPLLLNDQSEASFSEADLGIENPISDEELDMVLEYLQMNFPGLSCESLIDVYWANNGDMEGTIDMLNQLEQISLPDTLEIGDVPESASHKLKNVSSEAAASSSGSSESALVS